MRVSFHFICWSHELAGSMDYGSHCVFQCMQYQWKTRCSWKRQLRFANKHRLQRHWQLGAQHDMAVKYLQLASFTNNHTLWVVLEVAVVVKRNRLVALSLCSKKILEVNKYNLYYIMVCVAFLYTICLYSGIYYERLECQS